MNTNEPKTQLTKALGEPISREKALQLIQENPRTYRQFLTFPSEYQEIVLAFLQGNRGLPVVYDTFFQKIFNPWVTPERLERLLSCLMEQKVRIVTVLPREGSQMSEKGKSFTFKDMKPVYLIVLMESSSKNFKAVAPEYIHHVQYVCDTGAEVNFLANYTYVSLDTFHSARQNIVSYLDAWLTFLSSDDPKDIINLIATYPEFEEYYHDIALFRTKPEELINMYSEVLAQIDRNTERLMIDEMKQEVEELKQEAKELKRESEELKLEAEGLKQETEELKQETEELKQETEELKRENEELKKKHIMEYKNNARKLFVNGTSYETVRDSFDKEFLTDEDLKQIYDEVKASKKEQVNA